ncbi:hypothetical protein K2173_025487 [Erythroxylum novogranatense]|uniref:Uncharacterized protein n=1 Tax=Erythroxylum novogranatense TaxID=1862640 RepID=A0AAV8SB91_9ROSI|nr:hypothetical protein K2173_025487 [Erythroxylum novogranatense]
MRNFIKFLNQANIPPETETASHEDPESFYRAFSCKLLEASVKSDRGRLERILRQQQVVIIKVSKEQIAFWRWIKRCI